MERVGVGFLGDYLVGKRVFSYYLVWRYNCIGYENVGVGFSGGF